MNNEDPIREVLKTEDFDVYFQNLDERIKIKYDYVIQLIRTVYVINEKFVKKIRGTELYEVRVSVGTNEHRTMLISIDGHNFIESKRVLLLNGFLKKDNKQYKREIEKANQIVKKLED